jgi:O-glycosyl hydrolase
VAAALIGAAVAPVAPPASVAATEVRITPNPAYASAPFEGWGTSLVWFANATGGYPEAVRQELFAKVFGADGLNLNIARYNIGGGNATGVTDYLRPGGAVEGWWNPNLGVSDAQGPVGSSFADRHRYAAAWDADNPAHYDFTADETQRWWIDALKDRDDIRWEAFSNSPPYFLTESGYVSGGVNNPYAEQIPSANMDDFAGYLVTVVEHLEAQYGIDFETLEPFNEPRSGYWGTYFTNGLPSGKDQEGAYVGPARQGELIQTLADRLAEPGTATDVAIAAMDETNPEKFVLNWDEMPVAAKSLINRLNVHTYSTNGRMRVRDIAKSSDKPLWMSEVEGSWDSSGFNLENMKSGLGIANLIVGDLRELEPSAWVLWQPVEDTYKRQAMGTNWGSIFLDFDCNAEGNSVRRLADQKKDPNVDPTCRGIQTNAKYNTIRNFTHYIRPGDRLVPTDNLQTTAAVRSTGDGVTLVHVNDSASERHVTIDLSGFASIQAGPSVTPIHTTQSPAADPTLNALQPKDAVAVDQTTKTAVVSIPANSVSTLVVNGVTGVAATAPALRDGVTYNLVGAQSGKLLNADTGGLTIRSGTTTEPAATAQKWTVHTLSGEGSNRHRFALQAGDGRLLSAAGGVTGLSNAPLASAASDPALQWIGSTSDGKTYSVLSVSGERVLGVTNQSTSDGASVVLSNSNGGAHQRWKPTEVQPSGAAEVNVAITSAVTATYAESGYGPDRTKNGLTTDKGWSNWRGTIKNPQDTLTYTFPAVEKLKSARLHFYKDGTTNSWPQSVTVEYRAPSGTWTALPPTAVATPPDGSAPVVEISMGNVDATAVRVVLTAQPSTYMVVSEVQLFAVAPAS